MKRYIGTFLLVFTYTVLWAQIKNENSAVMYEVNTRQYSAAGNFDAVTQNIPTLKGMGIDILWLMPIHPIGEKNRKGELGSYYSVKDYRAIDPGYGGEDGLRTLVSIAHENGMRVIIDWVANHTAWDHAWINEHPEWYVHDSLGKIVTQYDWSDVAKLDYRNQDMRQAMIADMRYWVQEFGIDGFRCDVAFLVPQDFWEQAREVLESEKKVYMLAEMEWNADITATPNTYFNKAFNTSYGWNFMGVTQDMATHKKTLADFRKEMNENYAKFPGHMTKLFFITNHDENSWNGTIEEKYGKNWKLYATLCYTLPQSMPVMYTGEEAGLSRRLEFFQKDPVRPTEWADTSRYQWYRNLIQLRHTNKALWNENPAVAKIDEIDVSLGNAAIYANVYAFMRKHNENEVVVITNFGDKDMELPKESLGSWVMYKKLFDTKQFYKNAKGNWVIKANENVILFK
jgi:glycosidase